MVRVKKAVFQLMRDDTTLRSLLGITTLGKADGKICWHKLPSNPIYPSVIYRRLVTTQDKLFDEYHTLKSPMTFDIDIYGTDPSPEQVDNIKDRIIELFHNQQATLTALTSNEIHFYDAYVVDDLGDAFLDVHNRWFTTIRLEFRVQKVCGDLI